MVIKMERAKNKKRFQLIWRFGRQYLPIFIVAEICILVSYTVSILLPMNLSLLTDQVLYGAKHRLLAVVIRNYILLFSAAALFNLIYAWAWQRLNNRYVVDVKNAMFEKVVCYKAKDLTAMNTGDMMSRIDYDADQFIFIVQRNLFHFVNSALLCVGIVCVVARINIGIAALLAVAASLPICLTQFCTRFTQKYTQQTREVTGDFSGRLFEILKGMRDIKLLCAEWWANSRLFEPLKKLITLGNRTRRIDFLVNKGIYAVNLLTSLAVYSYSAYLIYRHHMTIGVFLAIVQYVALMHKKLNWMLRIYLDWYGRKVSIDRVDEVLQKETEDETGETLSEPVQSIEFRNVSFGYTDTKVLENLSFSIREGEKVAVVGNSGVGKTTLAALLLQLYEPQSGSIRINGADSRTFNKNSIRRSIGVVQQEVLLFDDTVRANLELGSGTHTDEELYAVCGQVGLLDLIRGLSEGLDTPLGDNRYGFSGGQKQRLMIARILLKDPPVVLFDEATSALDVETEKLVIDTLSALRPDRTMIIISHRLAAIKNCERVIVLENGRIESIGTHEELMEKSECYRALFGGKAA